MSKKKNNRKSNKGNQKKVQDIKNINKEAEEILNKLNEESKVEDKVETKKETTKENKPETKKETTKENKSETKKETTKENKPETKKETKKEAEEKLNQLNKSLQKNKKENKNNTEWLVNKNEDLKISDKIMKISSSVWSLQLMMMNKKYEFELTHKKNKNNVIKVRLRNEKIDLKIKFKETKDVSYKIKQIVNENGNESEKEYTKDYIEIDDNIIPLDIILMPVFDFYFTDKKIRKECIRYTEGNLKVYKDKITLDLNMRKEGYLIDPKGLSLESLKDLMDEDEDNILGGCVEYFRRNILVEEPEKEEEVEEKEEEKVEKEEEVEEKEEETMTLSDKIVTIIEDCDTKLKDRIMDDKIENKYEIIRKAMMQYPKAYIEIKKLIANATDIDYDEILNILKIDKETAIKLLNPLETPEEKYNEYLSNNEKAIVKMLDTDTTNIGERAIKFSKMIEEAGVDKKEIKSLLVSNDNWYKFVWDYNPYEEQVIFIINHIDECAL